MTDRVTKGRSTRGATGRRAAGGSGKSGSRRAPGEIDLYGRGARVVGVTGPFGSVALVEMPTELASEVFPDGPAGAAPLDVMEAAARDIDLIRARDEQLAGSALAAAAVALAREISNPYNSATSKSMCAREMREHLDRLRELLPPEKEADKIDDLARARDARRARSAGGAGTEASRAP